MPTSLCEVVLHIIFGTKGRIRCLNDAMYSYIAGIIKNNNGIPIIVNGTQDHVHILCYIPKDMTVPDFVRTIKASSSKWFPDPRMKWQTGYAAFSVSPTNVSKIKEYIAVQKEHHAKVEFSEEMKRYLIGEDGGKTWAEWFDDANNTD